jgi:foldase protein PrsA
VKRELAAVLIAAAVLSGCDSSTQPPPAETSPPSGPVAGPTSAPAPVDEVVATVRGQDITLKELEGPLVEAYGLNVLLEVIQLDLAEQEADRNNVAIAPQDVEDETTRTLIEFRQASQQVTAATTQPADDTLSPVERDTQLALLLKGEHLTRVEFDLAMKRNAYLRKIVAPEAQAQLTDDNVRERFNVLYGEKARVRFLRLPDMMAVAKVENELKAGRTLEEEIRLHAYDTVGVASGGELAPFSRKDASYPVEFKELAFGLKPGEIGDPLQIKDAIYLVQMIELIPPQHANFDDYKDSVRRDLYDQMVQAGVKQYLQSLGAVAHQTLEIKNPVLKAQWEQSLRNADELREQLRKEQAAATTRPAEPAEPAAAPGN